MSVGLYRDGDYAQVGYDERSAVPIHQGLYERRGYSPAFGDLPTRAEYERQFVRP